MPAYSDGELAEPRAAEFRAHLEACSQCREALARHRRLSCELRSARRAVVAPSRLRARVERILHTGFALLLAAMACFRRPF